MHEKLSWDAREPHKHLFVLKQHFLPPCGPHELEAESGQPYLSLVEHAVTLRDGRACVKFSVILSRPGQAYSGAIKTLYVNQNQQTLATNLTV